MPLCREVQSTFSISLVVLGFKKRSGRRGRGKERKMDGGLNGSHALKLPETRGRRLKTTSWEVFEMELQAYSALLGGLLDMKLHARSCKQPMQRAVSPYVLPFLPSLSLLRKLGDSLCTCNCLL